MRVATNIAGVMAIALALWQAIDQRHHLVGVLLCLAMVLVVVAGLIRYQRWYKQGGR